MADREQQQIMEDRRDERVWLAAVESAMSSGRINEAVVLADAVLAEYRQRFPRKAASETASAVINREPGADDQ
jgi:hypothetical protein